MHRKREHKMIKILKQEQKIKDNIARITTKEAQLLFCKHEIDDGRCLAFKRIFVTENCFISIKVPVSLMSTSTFYHNFFLASESFCKLRKHGSYKQMGFFDVSFQRLVSNGLHIFAIGLRCIWIKMDYSIGKIHDDCDPGHHKVFGISRGVDKMHSHPSWIYR